MTKTTHTQGVFKVEGVNATRSYSHEEFDALRAENERLRAALERIARMRAPDGANIARDALEQKAETKL